MKRLFSPLLAFLTPASATTAGPDPQLASTNAAKDWLLLLDRGDYRTGWNETAPSLQRTQEREAWMDDIATRRSKAGTLVFREVIGFQFKPARGEGALHTAVIRFRSQYQGGLLKETVSLESADGTWRIADYSLG